MLRQFDHQHYKRLGPGLTPGDAGLSALNRSASCRIPFVPNPRHAASKSVPDPMNSGYLTFTALMMAGLDASRTDRSSAPSDKDLYDLPPREKNIPKVCHSLDMALDALEKDRDFLKGRRDERRFPDSYIELKMGEVTSFRAATHPLEYQMYYGI